jgi:hypothetical protein
MVNAGAAVHGCDRGAPGLRTVTGRTGSLFPAGVTDFVRRAAGMRPLSQLTGGIPSHTLRCPDE